MEELKHQLKDKFQRIKSSGGYSIRWDARRSLNFLRLSVNCPETLPLVEDGSDEEMEIDEEDIEKHCLHVGLKSAACREHVHDVEKLPVQSVEDVSEFMCRYCKTRTPQLECNKEAKDITKLQLVPVEESQVPEKSKKIVPKAVEKVFAGVSGVK